ncbi:hypothetical protein PV08_10735 [Exophiala spinifera]|uniref:SnoaL-like domain-containing protein n=1 Tax=Exophiala spinifera TaxID=91928 RepID=A0A0D2AYG5_9EURO|nr:uncharacterized protein PV08_10735 [Exophiala spinifera]KIW11435.1 hypothetical protein PV08_10735 [Exophiala spinifera]
MAGPTELEPQVALPTAELSSVDDHISLLPPLSRRGYGPGLILVLPADAPTYPEGGTVCVNQTPPPLLKWAEEGFAVVEIREAAFKSTRTAQEVFAKAVVALEGCDNCNEKDGIGLIVYDESLWSEYLSGTQFDSNIKAAVIFGTTSEHKSLSSTLPILCHLAGSATSPPPKSAPGFKIYTYPTSNSSKFALPFQSDFNGADESVAHTRNLTHLKKYIQGAEFDLEAIWEEHTYYEFADRSAAKTMGTMVQEPYVNHITTMTGGVGREKLTWFYQNNFIHSNPDDTELQLVSRTLGIDRVVDEFIFKFTHDREVPWMIPGIPPTGKRVEVPFTAVVCIRGDRLYHEHISWDQASVLIQLGLMPEYLPYPHALPDGKKPAPGKKLEYRVPAAGIEISQKMVDKSSIQSNGMFEYEIREVDA